jgi:hypothetical protein
LQEQPYPILKLARGYHNVTILVTSRVSYREEKLP